jgi:pantoate--beta-alanine ligase
MRKVGFNIITPDYAFFGQKDFRKFIVIEKMVKDLCMSIIVVAGPTTCEKDGLA